MFLFVLFPHLDMFGVPLKMSSTICHALHVLAIRLYYSYYVLSVGTPYTLKQAVL